MLRYLIIKVVKEMLPKLANYRNNIFVTFVLNFMSRKTSIMEGLVWILQTFGRRSAAYIHQPDQISSYFLNINYKAHTSDKSY